MRQQHHRLLGMIHDAVGKARLIVEDEGNVVGARDIGGAHDGEFVPGDAGTEADLSRLSTLNNFAIDEDSNHLRIITTGTHDRAFMKRAARDFPKSLIGLPWKIDYHIKVPAVTDLEVNAGVEFRGFASACRMSRWRARPKFPPF